MEKPPDILPDVEWKKDNIRTTASCAFGKLVFENVEHSGGKKPAKVGTCIKYLVYIKGSCLQVNKNKKVRE